MRSFFLSLSILTALAIMLNSCKKENNAEEYNENELITTVVLEMKEQGGSQVQVFTWQDVDGFGGNEPTKDEIVLKENTTYEVTVSMWDESKTPAVDISAEIAEEADVHRLYYQIAMSSGLTIASIDKDPDGKTLGLSTVWTTGAAGTGTVSIILRHYPAGGKEESDPVTSSKSTTDAELDFAFRIGPL